jgi:hypothetical protein
MKIQSKDMENMNRDLKKPLATPCPNLPGLTDGECPGIVVGMWTRRT